MTQKNLDALQGILWDLDNTLYRINDAAEHAFNLAVARAALELGVKMTLDEARALAHESWLRHRHSGHEFIHRYNIAFADFHHATDRHLSGTVVEKCHITRSLFDRLDLRHALITHSARPWALRTLETLDLQPWFPDPQVFAYEDYDFHSKAESPKSFEMALASIRTEAGQAAMVEDTLVNLRVPYEMGMTTVFLHHGHAPESLPGFVDYSFANAREFLGAVGGGSVAAG